MNFPSKNNPLIRVPRVFEVYVLICSSRILRGNCSRQNLQVSYFLFSPRIQLGFVKTTAKYSSTWSTSIYHFFLKSRLGNVGPTRKCRNVSNVCKDSCNICTNVDRHVRRQCVKYVQLLCSISQISQGLGTWKAIEVHRLRTQLIFLQLCCVHYVLHIAVNNISPDSSLPRSLATLPAVGALS